MYAPSPTVHQTVSLMRRRYRIDMTLSPGSLFAMIIHGQSWLSVELLPICPCPSTFACKNKMLREEISERRDDEVEPCVGRAISSGHCASNWRLNRRRPHFKILLRAASADLSPARTCLGACRRAERTGGNGCGRQNVTTLHQREIMTVITAVGAEATTPPKGPAMRGVLSGPLVIHDDRILSNISATALTTSASADWCAHRS